MEPNLALKEEQYRKINAQLELKNKELTERVEDVMRYQEDFITNLFNKHDNQTEKLPNLAKTQTEERSRGILSCYKAKIKSVELQLEKLQVEIKNKCEEIKRIEKNNETLREEKEKWFLQYNLERNSNAKLEKEIVACNAKLQVKENENSGLKKEVESLKSELKQTVKELKASESRMKKTLNELDKTKFALRSTKEENRENQDLQKKNIQDLTITVKQIQKHKSELLQGYKRQIQLIENLKKQKAHIAACKLIDVAESDFLKLLEWKVE